jgi:hypothetical protein
VEVEERRAYSVGGDRDTGEEPAARQSRLDGHLVEHKGDQGI